MHDGRPVYAADRVFAPHAALALAICVVTGERLGAAMRGREAGDVCGEGADGRGRRGGGAERRARERGTGAPLAAFCDHAIVWRWVWRIVVDLNICDCVAPRPGEPVLALIHETDTLRGHAHQPRHCWLIGASRCSGIARRFRYLLNEMHGVAVVGRCLR